MLLKPPWHFLAVAATSKVWDSVCAKSQCGKHQDSSEVKTGNEVAHDCPAHAPRKPNTIEKQTPFVPSSYPPTPKRCNWRDITKREPLAE